MSYSDGWAAINLEMPARVPHTEYSIEYHFDLLKHVTGLDVNIESENLEKSNALKAFYKAWNYDFRWNILISRNVLESCCTKMGHAEYASEGSDYDSQISCPFNDVEEVFSFDPWKVYGEKDKKSIIRDFENNYNSFNDFYSDLVNMTGIYVSCISGLLEIFGWDMMLMALGTDAERFGEVTNRYASWIQQYFDALAETNVKVIMFHDDITWTSGPFCHPDWYKKFVFPNFKKYLAPLIESGKKIIYTSDGTYTMFIDDLVDCGVNGFVLEPSNDMALIAEKYGKTHVFIGNADTRILLSGSKDDIYNEVKRCMDIGKPYPGFFMAVGNHIPANTPVENALLYNEIYQELGKR